MTNKQNKINKITLSLLLSLGLTACNSSSSSNDSEDEQSTLTGKITGVPIAGLRYQTESMSGITASDGSFSYKANETITFAIGDITVGQSTAAASEVTLFDLVGITDPDTVTTAVETKYNSLEYYSSRAPSRFDYERLGNLVVFLTTVDDDNDLSNGVIIPADLASISIDEAIDINSLQNASFNGRLKNSDFLSEAVSQGVWMEKPNVPSTGLALDAFYASIGITPQLFTTSTELYDNDSDGTNDITISYSFNLDNNSITRTRTRTDNSFGDAYTYSFDEAGNQIGLIIDNDNDGISDYIAEWAFDEKGEKKLHQIDLDGNGTIDYKDVIETEYHANNDLSFYKRTAESFSEDTGERENFRSVTYHYDTNREITYEFNAIQSNPESMLFAQSTTYTRDANGKPTSIIKDIDGDGTPDEISTFQYDEEGNETLAETDSNADGIIDSSVSTSYERIGNQLTVTRGDAVHIATYDEHENIVRELIDSNNDGIYEYDTTSVINYDAEGRILTEDKTSPTTQLDNYQQSFSYNEEGEILKDQRTYTFFTELNTLSTRTLDDEGNILSTTNEYGSIDSGYYWKGSHVYENQFGGHSESIHSLHDGIEGTSTSSVRYNESGYLVEESSSGSDQSTRIKTWYYNTEAQLINYSFLEDGAVVSNKEYSYDELGERESLIYADGSINTYESTSISSWQLLFLRLSL